MYLLQVCPVFAIILACIQDLTMKNDIKGKGLLGIVLILYVTSHRF